MINHHTNNQRKLNLDYEDLLHKIVARFGLVIFMILLISTAMMQDVFAEKFDKEIKHRATIIDINGNEVNQHHPKFGELIQDGGISVHPDDSLALVALYHSMNGDSWRNNTGWLTDKVEFWPGVHTVEEVNPDEWRVVFFISVRENMTVAGTIAPEVGNMAYLRRFRVQNDLLTGSIPPEFGNISTLEMLFPQNNFLSGEVPWRELAQLDRLSNLTLRFNFLSGDIPSWVGEDDELGNPYFERISEFMITDNKFTGSIPASLGNRQTLSRFGVSNNLLTGPIPDWSHLENVQFYFIDNNNFDPGPIPAMISNWDKIERLQLSNTNRTGVIPEWFGQLTSLERLMGIGGQDEIGGEIPESMKFLPNLWDVNISGGTFSGPIPAWIAEMPSLEIINFQDINFTGTLPASYGSADGLRRIYISGTNIEGGIPEVWQTLSRLEIIQLSNNPNMELGNIPDWMAQNWTSLEEINLSNVGVTGEIPSNFSTLDGLERLILNNNPGLTGDLPGWLENRNLRELSLSNTGLNINEIPDYIRNWTRLDALALGGYGIDGQLPDWLGNENMAPTLRVLALDNNNFSGEIPASIGNLFVLDSLNLAHNILSGDLPVSMLNLGKADTDFSVLQSVVLSGNEGLTGVMPMFPDARFMRVVEFDGTAMCEPSGFAAWANAIETEATSNYPQLYYSIKGTNLNCDVTSNEHIANLPGRVKLLNNYPNPFNPVTTIPYSIPHDMHVSLNVYSILGQHVATLVDEQKTPGRYEVSFDASKLASGYYIYRLETAESILTSQMLLIK